MNRVICDTQAAVGWFAGAPKLSAQAFRLVEGAETVFVSLASIWDISIRIGRLGAERTAGMEQLLAALQAGRFAEGFEFLAPEPADFVSAGLLPPHHPNPFDRLLMAQALRHDLPVISTNAALDAYGVTRIW